MSGSQAAQAERDQLPEVGHEARAKASVAEDLLAERERGAATAARLSPPDYITNELGERPSDPGKAREWDKAVHGIESYRLRNDVVDRDSALGAKPHEHAQAHEHEQTRAADRAAQPIERSQRQLQRSQQRAAERSIASRDWAMSQSTEHPPRSISPLVEPLLNADEAAQLLHVPRSTLYELVRSRHLPHVRVGRGLRFCRHDLAEWVMANTFR